MSVACLFEARTQIRRLLIAGAHLAKADYRLERLSAELRESGTKSPVFARAAEMLEACVNPKEGTSNAAESLLDAGSSISAVLSTQATMGLEGDFEPESIVLTETFGPDFDFNALASGRTLLRLPGYRELSPVMKALTSRGAGRLQVINDAAESGYLFDYRLLPHLVCALADSFTEVSALALQALIHIGKPALPVLLEGFALDNPSRANQNRFVAIVGITGRSGAAFSHRVFFEGTKGLRAQALEHLASMGGNEQLILDATQDSDKEVRETAERLVPPPRTTLKSAFTALFGKKDRG